MIEVYRLHRSRYAANDGRGSAINGGRWNPRGTEVIYTAGSRSLAALEILVHYGVIPHDFVVTPVSLPDDISLSRAPDSVLITGWNAPEPLTITQEFGGRWIVDQAAAVLIVPSAVIPFEFNYVINVWHPEFQRISFGAAEPFHADSRLRGPSGY